MRRMFQSTRPRGARRGVVLQPPHGALVSIHAPARGATVKLGEHLGLFKVSIHAPARGATCQPRQMYLAPACFNPRARAGRDEAGAPVPASSYVSIHAPARGATREASLRGKPITVSIHAPARGATSFFHANAAVRPFQSTRPRGARRDGIPHSGYRGGFNPRARAGRDEHGDMDPSRLILFQSTRPRGARHDFDKVETPKWVFQSTRPRGARLEMGYLILDTEEVSIHAPARGAT